MSRSGRFLIRMAVFVVLVAALAAALFRPLATAFMGNPGINGVILGILLCGIVYIFRQVLLLNPETAWIEDFRERLANRDLTAPSGPPPRLLAPMARMLSMRQGGR
ncbi:MAG TPA: flagellar motor protein MotA, partial [Stellaceae bacterium]|nr:flagellar motor protein MotA [Stellaceae bacterium]